MSREIAASPERVFEIWTDPKQIARWFGLDGITNIGVTFEPRLGGTWQSRARDPEGREFSIEGAILAFEPARRLVQSWAHVDHEGVRGNETELEVLFEPAAGGCRVTLHHRKIRFTPERFKEGWTQSLARIADLAA